MSELQRLVIEEDGKTVEIYVEGPPMPSTPPTAPPGQRPGEKGATETILLKMDEIQTKVTTYANFAIGAVKNLAGAEVEEITLKFGMKLGGKTGVIFTEGSAEGSMEVSVKCKFPK